MASKSPFQFLVLPRELRDDIYVYYLTLEGGYVFNYESGKLVTANSDTSPIDLALMYTCTVVADEMKGLALRENCITLYPVTSAELRVRAARFHALLQDVLRLERGLLQDDYDYNNDPHEDVPPRYNQHVVDQVSRISPHAGFLLQVHLDHDTYCLHYEYPYGIARSEMRQALHHAVQLTLDQDLFAQPQKAEAQAILPVRRDIPPWAIPTEEDLERMSCLVHRDPDEFNQGLAEFWSNSASRSSGRSWHWHFVYGIYRFSAAAVAVHFLSSISPNTRQHIRQVKLCEDRKAVGNSECHALGLIPFCQANTLMRIERRVNLWKNAFQKPRGPSKVNSRNGVHSLSASELIIPWIAEAMALEPAGMPAESFNLVLDGDLAPEQCSEIWQTRQREVVSQKARQDLQRRKLVRNTEYLDGESELHWGCFSPCGFHGMEKALDDIANGTSVVRCNFPLPPRIYADEIIANAISLGSEWWYQWRDQDWNRSFDEYHEPDPPNPGWTELLKDNILPEFFERYPTFVKEGFREFR
ncbi:Uu.00g028300.m01.CDS01 [Anthostomella pinea]|uniref:Uu.00g028300.m01.CDS01 n=1 Tax=Anthostomella pinea TaxID=933095 RepID=A0AAI8V8G6_9PEZI|nr:Uu.00g028300.m01.CDS01 [Anthostomella pinea]